MNLNRISGTILNEAFKIHRQFGPGLMENAYEKMLSIALRKKGLFVECQKAMHLNYLGETIPNVYFADLIVERRVLVELKSVEDLHSVYFKQVLTYLKVSDLRLGLLINFNEVLLKQGIRRVVN